MHAISILSVPLKARDFLLSLSDVYANIPEPERLAMHERLCDPLPMHVHLLSGTSGNRSMTYLPFATLTMGTPGIFLILLFKSLSFVATK
jgi:hypothetical protein